MFRTSERVVVLRQALRYNQGPHFEGYCYWERKSMYSTSRIRHLNSTGVEISSVVEYIDLRSQYPLI